MEDEESLETSALISEFPDAIQYQVNNLLANCVVTTSIVVSCILLASDELLWMEQLTICPGTHLIYKEIFTLYK